MFRKKIGLGIILIFILPMVLNLAITPNAGTVTMRQVKVRLFKIDVTNNHDQSCDKVTWYWGVRWKRIYNNYWDEFYTDNKYGSTGEWSRLDETSAGSFTDDRYYQSTHYDNEYSPYVYSKDGYIYLFAMVRIEKSAYGQCGWGGTEASGQINIFRVYSHNTEYQITVNAYGGSSTFYFKILWY